MARFASLKIGAKFNIIMSLLLISLFVMLSRPPFRQSRSPQEKTCQAQYVHPPYLATQWSSVPLAPEP